MLFNEDLNWELFCYAEKKEKLKCNININFFFFFFFGIFRQLFWNVVLWLKLKYLPWYWIFFNLVLSPLNVLKFATRNKNFLGFLDIFWPQILHLKINKIYETPCILQFDLLPATLFISIRTKIFDQHQNSVFDSIKRHGHVVCCLRFFILVNSIFSWHNLLSQQSLNKHASI